MGGGLVSTGDPLTDLAREIEQFMFNNRLTQAEVAKHAKVSQALISKIIHRKHGELRLSTEQKLRNSLKSAPLQSAPLLSRQVRAGELNVGRDFIVDGTVIITPAGDKFIILSMEKYEQMMEAPQDGSP
jgi:predicted XRE-type DNA-binding protein